VVVVVVVDMGIHLEVLEVLEVAVTDQTAVLLIYLLTVALTQEVAAAQVVMLLMTKMEAMVDQGLL
jgi:hypothetical protein